ncbi:palmitoyl-protein hydrolase [Malassezia sp. CBS 17886]|nr:palmitoyl-protein hydrolase [Malassezia sp. CBS 17886]
MRFATACVLLCLAAFQFVDALPRWPGLGKGLPGDWWRPLPVVIWHGLGDSAQSPWLRNLKGQLEHMYPGIYVHLVEVQEGALVDQRATVFGNVNAQIDAVRDQLLSVPELRRGFDAVGFSQGGQFLRGFTERYNTPPVRNLVTFGSQHMGITDLPLCAKWDVVCRSVHSLLSGGVYTDYAQENVVVAQYFRDVRTVDTFERYKKKSHFLHDINNEAHEKNEEYKRNMRRLNKFVMVQFDNDKTVVPAASSWFSTFSDPDPRDDSAPNATVPLRQSRLYTEDWLGLRAIDRRGGLVFQQCHGTHMSLDAECLTLTFGQYVGRPRLPGRWSAVASGVQTREDARYHHGHHNLRCASRLLYGLYIFLVFGAVVLAIRRYRRRGEQSPVCLAEAECGKEVLAR